MTRHVGSLQYRPVFKLYLSRLFESNAPSVLGHWSTGWANYVLQDLPGLSIADVNKSNRAAATTHPTEQS